MPIDSLVRQAEEHPKGWGREIWIVNCLRYCGKILELKTGKRCSIHYHGIKDETFYILSGKVLMNIYHDYPGEPTGTVMSQGGVLHIPSGRIHQFVGIEDSRILEISTYHWEGDSYRLAKGD